MEIYAAVQPLVMTREGYSQVYGEDDPEELALMQLQDRQFAEQMAEVLHDLYFLETNLAAPNEGEGLGEEIGTLEDLQALKALAAEVAGHSVDDFLEGRVPAGATFNHLINHADDSGYYVPYDFPQAFVWEDVSIGSSVALLKELEALSPILLARYPEQMALAQATPDEAERAALSGPVSAWHSLCRLCRSANAANLPIHIG